MSLNVNFKPIIAILMMAYGKKVRSLSNQSDRDDSSHHKTAIADTYIGKAKEINDKTSLSSAEEINIRTYTGFADINFITANDAKSLFNEIANKLGNERIKIYRKKMYNKSCQKQKVKFNLEIMRLDEPCGFNYIRLNKLEGTMEQYKTLVGKLTSTLLL